MLKKNTNLDIDDEPRPLRSDLPSNWIPICKPSHLSSLSLETNSLQISQSSTKGFATPEDKSQFKMSGKQALSMNATFEKENVNCRSVPLDTSDRSQTTNQTGSASNNLVETKQEEKEKLVSKQKSDDQAEEQEHKGLPPTEYFDVSCCPPIKFFPNLSSETSFGTSSHGDKIPLCNRVSDLAFSTSPEFLAACPTASLSEVLSSLKFFSFVILHVPEDQEEAGRVCGILNSLKIGEGTTFCEGFETAGVSPLRCLEDAVENSAYIVLLLTTGFLSKWGEFQTNTVLMNSIEDPSKSGTIIPFIPKFKTPIGRIPLALKSLIPLNEKSPLFEKQVHNTFKQNEIKRQKKRWQREQDLRAFQKQFEDAKDVSNAVKLRHRITMDISSLLSDLPPQIIPGCGSVIQINNASNIQIGNQNCMSVQQTTNLPHMEMSGECFQQCDKEFQS